MIYFKIEVNIKVVGLNVSDLIQLEFIELGFTTKCYEVFKEDHSIDYLGQILKVNFEFNFGIETC